MVLRCESVPDFVNENGNLVLNSLRHAQPVNTDKCVGDVVRSMEMILQSRSENKALKTCNKFKEILTNYTKPKNLV